MPPVISIRDLGIAFGEGDARTEVLKSLDLDIAPGEFLAIVGASGVGKSTLLRILMGLARPSHGTMTIAQAPGAGGRLSHSAVQHLRVVRTSAAYSQLRF